MDLDSDTFLVTVYCVCDDLYRAEFAPELARRPGAKGKLADSEVLTLAVLAQWHPHRCERCFLRYARRYWQGYFPGLTSQSAFNRRVRNLWGALSRLGPLVAQAVERLLGSRPAYEVWDGLPIPLLRRCRGARTWLFGAAAGFGRGGSDREWYYGVKLLAAVSPHGTITGWVTGPADTAEYWLAEALLRWRATPTAPPPDADELAPVLGPTHARGGQRRGPSGPLGPRLGVGQPATCPAISDLGLAGQAWRNHWRRTYGAVVLTKAEYAPLADSTVRHRLTSWLCGRRQVVETVFHVLDDHFGVKFPRVRGLWGLWTRLAAKIAAFNLAVYLNHCFGRATFALFNPIS
jgi:hypothetical protein